MKVVAHGMHLFNISEVTSDGWVTIVPFPLKQHNDADSKIKQGSGYSQVQWSVH